MKRLLALCLAAISCVGMAQQQPTGTLTSPNLVYSTVNPWQGPAGSTSPGTWQGFVVTESTGGGVSGGNQPGYNVSTGTFMFGYTQSTIAYNYALSQALKNSGMSWLGYNYAWEYYNQDLARGTLSANLAFNSTNGTVLHNKNWTLGATTEGWTAMSGTETFTNPLATANINSFTLSFAGKDDRFWAGFYGPMVRNPSVSVLYTFDQCVTNPLSSPDCAGYQQALLDQQCTANPLYNSACPGYAAAYQTQQCTVNPLYSPECPGYQTAYFNQQCTANPLYATTCPGYATAYKTQQCSLNPLYATDCTGYADAYKTQQCSLNSLYSPDCSGYATAYKTQQCTANPLYATDCPGYEQAYLNAQCIKDSLYSRLCTGYATAYAIKYLTPALSSTAAAAVNSSLATTAEIKAMDPTSVNTTGSVTGSTTVDSVISTPSTTSATSPTSVNSVIAPPPPPPGVAPTARAVDQATAPPPPPPPAKQAERAADARKTEGAVAAVEKRAGNDPERAKREATDRAKQLATIAGEAATLEAQQATQGLVVGLMNYVPGFSAYQNAIVPDVLGAAVARQYHKPTTDNRSAQRQLSGSNEIRWREMVDSQYRGK
jgi:hypothetical protein